MSTYTTAALSVTFTAAEESWQEPSGSEVNVIGYPGGDAIAISIGGQRETRRTFKALLSNQADFTKLKAMRAKTGWLQVDNWDAVPVQAVLERVTPDPIQADGKVYAQVQFVLY